MPMRNPFRLDVVLLHAPSVYDYRRDPALFGPISDVIPSGSIFDMYPMGLTSIGGVLERSGYNARIINMAALMRHSPDYDPEPLIARLKPLLFGVDLHWLPHAHGAIEVARLIKRHHPGTPVLLGGLSASFYHEELIRDFPMVDFVLRGDSTEPAVVALVQTLVTRTPLEAVPNLTWRRPDGTVAVNPMSHVPADLDYTSVPHYRYAIRASLKYGNVRGVLPYLGWWDYPITALLTARGCALQCAVCGGSRDAFRRICARERPAYRSAEALARDVATIRRFTRGPIFVIHDIRMGGLPRARRFLELLAARPIDNELILELFSPAEDDFFRQVAAAAPNFSVQITLESQDPELRRLNGKFPVSNAEAEATIAAALGHGARYVDVFFMVGLPGQTPASALGVADYAAHLLERFPGGRVRVFAAPLAPFLDPGSRAFTAPEVWGYRLRFHSLAEHRAALAAPSWKHMLNYETEHMDRDALVETTYALAVRLIHLKARHGLLSPEEERLLVERIRRSQEVIRAIDAALEEADPALRAHRLARARAEAKDLQDAGTLNRKTEMFWPIPHRVFRLLSLTGLLLSLAAEEIARTVKRTFARP